MFPLNLGCTDQFSSLKDYVKSSTPRALKTQQTLVNFFLFLIHKK